MFCSNCEKEVEEGMRFCTNCGNKIDGGISAAQSGINPKQTVNTNESNLIIKQDELCYTGGGIKKEKGILMLYSNRLEWKGEKGNSAVINLSEISDVNSNSLLEKLTITLVNAQNHIFTIPVTSGKVVQGLLLGGIGTTLVSKQSLDAWKSAINNQLREIK
jgi:hypothetical protein